MPSSAPVPAVAIAKAGLARRVAVTLAVALSAAACGAPPHVSNLPAGAADWPVYHRAADRHGVDPTSQVTRRMAPLWGARLDGSMFAQPLVVQGLLVEATEHDSVYAFDATSGCAAWRTSLGTPLDTNRHRLQCNNITPELGITATPAIDTTTSTIYVVAYFDPGRYESFGGRAGDCGLFHGFVVGVNTDGTGPDPVVPGGAAKAAIWAPGGPVVMPDGDLLVSIG